MAFAALASPIWLRRNPQKLSAVGFLIGYCPFFFGMYHSVMAIISWPEWPGYVKGMEISIVDFLALAVYLSLPRKNTRLPFKFAMGAYFVAAALSITQSNVPMASFFYCWQLLRLYFLYMVVARGCENLQFSISVMKGLAAAVIIEAFDAGSQHFLFGVLQAPGTFGHQNTLGMATNMIVFPFFALLLSGRNEWLCGAVVLSGLLIELVTVSRATLGLGALGFGSLIVLSLARKWTSRKASFLAIGVVLAVMGGVVAAVSLGQRFKGEADSDYNERAAFEKAASLMLGDHPLGVGANEYVVVANTQGYNDRAGVAHASGSEAANVHNVYRLVAAETGYFGVVTYVLLLVRCAVFIFLRGWRNRYDQRGDLLLGVGVGSCVFCLHSLYEWVPITLQIQTIYVVLLGLAVGVSNQIPSTLASPRPRGARLTRGPRDRRTAERLTAT
jgi:O-Antigen ligase